MLKHGSIQLINFVFFPKNRIPKNRDSRTEFPGIPFPGKTCFSREILVPGISRVQPYGGWNLIKKRPNFCILADVRQFGGGGWWWGVRLGIIELREAGVDRQWTAPSLKQLQKTLVGNDIR